MGLTSFLLNEWVVSGNTHLGLLQTCTGQNCTSIHTFNCSSSAASDSCGQGELVVRGLIHDHDELGISYHDADPILHWFLRGYTPSDLVRRGFDESQVDIVWNRLNATHWKRELPTVAVLSSTAIGESYLRPVDY